MEATQIADIIQQLLALIGIVFGTESAVIQTIVAIIATLSIVVGSASAIVAALEEIAKVTPTTKDDILVGKLRRFISRVVAVLDRVALNPDKTKAREPDK